VENRPLKSVQSVAILGDPKMKRTACYLIAAVLLLASCSRDPKKYIESGKKYFAEKKYQEAALEFRNALKKDPQSVEAHSQMGLTYLAVGQSTEALQEYQRVVTLDPNRIESQLKLGNLLLLQQKFPEARARAELILKREPRNVHALIMLANSYSGLVHLNDSIEELMLGFEREPRLLPSYLNRGAGQEGKLHPQLAEDIYLKAVASDSRSVEARLALAN